MEPSWSLSPHCPGPASISQKGCTALCRLCLQWNWIFLRTGVFSLSSKYCASCAWLSCPEWQRGTARQGAEENPRRAMADGQVPASPCSALCFPPRKQSCRHTSAHKTRGILSAEISGNFTRIQITSVCRVQHCLEREQQAFPLEASFLFRAVYSRGAVSHCGTNTLSAFGLEDGHLIPLSGAKMRCPDPTPGSVIF